MLGDAVALLPVEWSASGPMVKSIDECRLEWLSSRIDAADGRDGLSSPEVNVNGVRVNECRF
jgi:hypothetical protein